LQKQDLTVQSNRMNKNDMAFINQTSYHCYQHVLPVDSEE